MFNTEDTIAAVSSSAGVADRAIVRVSGPKAINIVEKYFICNSADLKISDLAGFRWTDGRVSLDGSQIPARAYVFRNPRSYTRQDLIELHVPGNPYIINQLTESLLSGGCRQAGPGEFTARAFFSGRIDLSQAQAVADVIEADDDQQLRSALSIMDGTIHRLCMETSIECTDILAVVEASIDMADEDIELDSPLRLASRLEKLSTELLKVVQSAQELPEKSHHPLVVIAGRPNVGKSSLLNNLCREQRAIVSALAGTTRDVLSVVIDINGHDIEFKDVAGFMAPEDALAHAADQAADNAVAQADVILMMVDITADDFKPDVELLERINRLNRTAKIIWIANKCDIAKQNPNFEKIDTEALFVSANTGAGVDELKEHIINTLHLSVSRGGDVLGLHTRQKRCLQSASESASNAASQLRNASSVVDVSEFAALDIRQCLDQIGQISGQVVTEDILGRIFERFCVGK